MGESLVEFRRAFELDETNLDYEFLIYESLFFFSSFDAALAGFSKVKNGEQNCFYAYLYMGMIYNSDRNQS